jgi:two-component system response regulator AtoC
MTNVAILYASSVGNTTPRMGSAANAVRGDFILVAGHGQLITRVLDKDELVIGRDPKCDIVVDHSALSRRHAILRLGPPVTLQDLGSTNGVRISRKTTRGGEPIALEPGETFHIGGFSFNLVGREHSDPSPTNRSGRDRLRVEDPTQTGVPGFVRDVAASSTSVLVLGESGVGKDVLAETLHVLSGRAGELARVNCAALAEPLIESELFGHEKGAFTGATGSKVGLLESAQGGTVFLDEIGELPLGLQAKLLRAIESREILRIGSIRPVKIDVRFIAATNRDLPSEVAAKRFRHDLYFRLDGITLVIPPLRERRERIASLAIRFLEAASQRKHTKLAPDVFSALHDHDWPGNVRELKAVIERGLLLARGGELKARHLAFSPRVDAAPPAASPPAPTDDDPALAKLTIEERTQRTELIEALAATSGNQTRAAKLLGISRTTMVSRIKLFRLSRPRG